MVANDRGNSTLGSFNIYILENTFKRALGSVVVWFSERSAVAVDGCLRRKDHTEGKRTHITGQCRREDPSGNLPLHPQDPESLRGMVSVTP